MKFRQLLPIYFVIFLSFLGYALTITMYIPMLLSPHFNFLPVETSLPLRIALTGSLLATYPLGQLIGSPIIGKLSNNFGHKRALLISLFGCALGFAGIAISIRFQQISLLFFSSLFTGMCESNMQLSLAIITDRTEEPALKTKLINNLYVACSLGYIIGPLLGGTSGMLLTYSIPFWITALCIAGLIIWVSYSLTEHKMTSEASSGIRFHSFTALKSIFREKRLLPFYLLNFLIFFAARGIYRMVPLYIVDKWHPSLLTYSLLIYSVAYVCFLTTSFILGRIVTRFSLPKLLSSLLLIGGILILSLVIPYDFRQVWVIYVIAMIPIVMTIPICSAWLFQQAKDDKQNTADASNYALLTLAESSSAAIGGLIAALLVPLSIVTMGIILLITGFIVIWLSRYDV